MRIKLKMEILQAYGSQRNFAQAIGKSDNWVSEIVQGLRNPTQEDRDLIISKLGRGIFDAKNK